MTTIIGDVHGKFEAYKQITNDCEYSVQIGDMGLDYSYLFYNLDDKKHKFLGGNHDNYDQYPAVKHSLGDYGDREVGGLDFFFIRGAFSVDIGYRLVGTHGNMSGYDSWWNQEELNYAQMRDCEELYKKSKPRVVLTHTAPHQAITDNFSNDLLIRLGLGHDFCSKTSGFLQVLFELHQPDIWVFGHFHKDIKDTINGTEFICLPELGFIDL
jgi:predicted phosphodiesterase